MCHTAAAVRLSLFRGGARLLQVLPIVQSLVHEAGQTNSLQVCMSKTFIWLTHMHQVPSIRMQHNFTGMLQITASTPLNNILNNKTYLHATAIPSFVLQPIWIVAQQLQNQFDQLISF